MRKVKTLGLLGTGVIGGGWAARALHFGIDVIAADVKPEMEEWIRGAVANAEPALARLTFAPLPPKGNLPSPPMRGNGEGGRFHPGEHPEQLPLKQRMLAEVSRHAAADVIIASSTSGLTPTDLQRDMVAPERFCVAHPFNPVYLLPLVELVAGAKTAPATIEAAAQFFTYIGMHALRVRREVPGTFDRPVAGGHVAGNPAHGQRRRGDHGRARRVHHLWPGAALGRRWART